MKILYKNKHWNIVEDYDINKILYLLIDRPDCINFFNSFIWENNKYQFHREYDFPAIIDNDYYIAWRMHDAYRRKNNKPVEIWHSGNKEY